MIKNHIDKRFLYLIAAAIWGIPGLMIALKGIRAYTAMPADELWWLCIITLGILISFIWMFRRIVNRYCNLIATLPDKTTIGHTFPLRGWVLIVCMSGLGPALVVAGCLFLKKYMTR